MLSIRSETLLQHSAAKFVSDKISDREQAVELLELMLDQNGTATLHLLEEQLQHSPDPTRRRG
jgi:hypothetical protein